MCFQGVESERCASFSEAMKAGKPVRTEVSSTIADGEAISSIFERVTQFFISIELYSLHETYTNKCNWVFSGLAVPTVGVNAFATAKDLIDKMVVVK